MKNKIQLIDVSILSSYMGGSLTLIVAVFVVALAVSAVVTGGGAAGRNIVHIWVPQVPGDEDAPGAHAALRSLVAQETRRPAVVVSGPLYREGCDLYLVPAVEFWRDAGRLGLEPIAEVWDRPGDEPVDEAVIIARAGESAAAPATLPAADVAFEHATSVNRFWVQMAFLLDQGFRDVGNAETLRFTGDAEAVVLGVCYGAFRLGACRLSDVNRLVERGAIRPDELEVIFRAPVLPELLLASPAGSAPYFRSRVARIGKLLANGGRPSASFALAVLRTEGMRSIVPIDEARISQVQHLFERLERYFDSPIPGLDNRHPTK